MPRVFIPPLLKPLCDDESVVEMRAGNVRQIIDELENRFPGVRNRLCDGDDLKSGLTVAVDANVSSLGMLQRLSEDSEVHFLPAIGGG